MFNLSSLSKEVKFSASSAFDNGFVKFSLDRPILLRDYYLPPELDNVVDDADREFLGALDRLGIPYELTVRFLNRSCDVVLRNPTYIINRLKDV